MERHRIPRIHAIRTYKIFRFLQPQQENHGKSQKEQHQKKNTIDNQTLSEQRHQQWIHLMPSILFIIVFRSNTVSHICDLSKKVKFYINQVGVGWLYMRKQDITPYHTGRNIQVHVQRGKKNPKNLPTTLHLISGTPSSPNCNLSTSDTSRFCYNKNYLKVRIVRVRKQWLVPMLLKLK